MGVPKNREGCPWDNACFMSGPTPIMLYVTVSGIERLNPLFPPPPNGCFRLEQANANQWLYVTLDLMIELSLSPIWTYLFIYHYVGTIPFSDWGAETCARAYKSNDDYTEGYKGGVATISLEGPPYTLGSNTSLAQAVGVAKPDSCQFEYNATPDVQQRVRIAQKFDKTCVYLKRSSEF